MFKLKVVAGPNRGTSYALQGGENSIGRQIGNSIVLQSTKVSKQHCLLLIKNDEVELQDQNSVNGTFVNGVLTRGKKVRSGDRITVGEYVLELVKPPDSKLNKAPPVVGLGNVVPFPKQIKNEAVSLDGGTSTLGRPTHQAPTDLKEKIGWYFEKQVMPFFYGLNFRYDLRSILIGIFTAIGIGNVLISVHPLLESSRISVVKEVSHRAQFMAKQMADRYVAAQANHVDSRNDLGITNLDESVRLALITDLDHRILAPAQKANQYFTAGSEARFAVKAKTGYLKGRESGLVDEVETGTVVAIEPIKSYDPRLGRNVVIAMAIISLDATLATLNPGEIGRIYSETFLLNGVLLLFFFFVIYFLILKPFQVLNDDMDKVLKGDMNQVTHEFKWPELNSLWDVINSALQRIPRSHVGAEGLMEEVIVPTSEEFSNSISMLGKIAKFGVVVCDSDRKVLQLNSIFEEISGIREESAIGQTLASVGRDQAFIAICNDLFDRAPVGGSGISEDFEFSGISYRMHAVAFGPSGRDAKNYILAAEKIEDGG